jgi:AraC-like DNA-binding protein
MDTLTATLAALSFRGRLYCRVEARAPWGLSSAPSDVATFHGVLAGQAVLRVGKGTSPVKLEEGDVAIVCHGEAHSIRDSLASPTAPIGDLLASAEQSKLIRVGGTGTATTLVCGCFYSQARDVPPMFALLPPVLHIHARHAPSAWALVDLLATEARLGTEGSGAVSARLSEALFIVLVRAWSKTHEEDGWKWMKALSDPRIAAALGVMHRTPAEEHTLSALARVAGMSRSVFAERFRELVGEAPMQYLIRWRLYLASVMLRETDMSVGEIAARIGYESEASLTKAFTLRMRKPPGAYRRASEAVELRSLEGLAANG